MVLHTGANQCTGPVSSTKGCFIVVGNITSTVNKGRQAGWANEQSISLHVYGYPSLNVSNWHFIRSSLVGEEEKIGLIVKQIWLLSFIGCLLVFLKCRIASAEGDEALYMLNCKQVWLSYFIDCLKSFSIS